MSISSNYKLLNGDDLSLGYFGSFDDAIVEKIIELSEAFLEASTMKNLRKKAVFLSAECFQNVARHGIGNTNDNDSPDYQNAFFLRIKNKIGYIASVNIVENKKIDFISGRIEKLNNMDQNELYDLYKKVLQDGKLSSRGGASLGLIEMARKTGNKIEFRFESSKSDYSRFYMMLGFTAKENPILENDKKIIFSEIVSLYKELQKSGNYLLFKSDFRQQTILPVVQMIQDNLDNKSNPYQVKKNLFHASVEILQFISQSGNIDCKQINALFLFGKKKDDFIIQSISELNPEEEYKITNGLKKLEGMSKEDLKKRYRKKMMTGKDDSYELKFIDLARISKEWSFHIINLSNSFPLFSYKLTL